MTGNHTWMTIISTTSWKKRFGIVLTLVFVVTVCVVIRHLGGGPEKADATQPQSAKGNSPNFANTKIGTVPQKSSVRQAGLTQVSGAQQSQGKKSQLKDARDNDKIPPPEIVADVNGQKITREELADQCLAHYGKEILEHMLNKYLIASECRRRNITVSGEEIDAEIDHMASRFGLPVDQWLKLLKQERNISPSQYADDIVWPTLALRKLAGERLHVSKEELIREYETRYGPSVKARLIAANDPVQAKKLREMALANPEEFGNLAKDYSEDTPSAAAKGLIQPIHMHGSYERIEKAAFTMSDGEISEVIPAGGQFVIIKRESLIPAQDYKLEQVSGQLEEIIREGKLRKVSSEIFAELQKGAKVENVLNDPIKQQKMPGVAATINGEPITIRELAMECIERHGKEVLEGEINRALLEVDCRKRGIKITDTDIDEEIARAASLSVKPKSDGSPDVETWLKSIVRDQGISLDVYRHDAVWPSVALRKLSGEKVAITEEDLQKGFEANYGQKVRCLAIVLNNERRAHEVFDKARKNNTSENFGDLATQYSIEPGSNALRGEVPPIRRWGGQPILEQEAFSLKSGQLSGVIQAGDKFIILRCEGYTQSADVKFADVSEEIRKDLFEKKLRLKMAEYFENLQDAATVHNYLAGTSHAPKENHQSPESLNLPQIKQVPAGKG
jgi:parvulin-like peptidyl-prolyl isomerase